MFDSETLGKVVFACQKCDEKFSIEFKNLTDDREEVKCPNCLNQFPQKSLKELVKASNKIKEVLELVKGANEKAETPPAHLIEGKEYDWDFAFKTNDFTASL